MILFSNLRKLKYENNEIPNSLRGSLSCVEFVGSTQNEIKYDMHDDLMYNISKLKIWDVTNLPPLR